jgi:fumarate reductase subunit D
VVGALLGGRRCGGLSRPYPDHHYWISDSGMLYRNWLVKIYLFVLIALPLYHWAHRFYFALNDMKLGLPHKPLAALCYGGAIVVTVVTLWVLLSL